MPRIRCTSCGHELSRHCSVSHTCRWMACLTPGCKARFYDTDRGVRSLRDGTIEVLGRPPVAPEPD